MKISTGDEKNRAIRAKTCACHEKTCASFLKNSTGDKKNCAIGAKTCACHEKTCASFYQKMLKFYVVLLCFFLKI